MAPVLTSTGSSQTKHKRCLVLSAPGLAVAGVLSKRFSILGAMHQRGQSPLSYTILEPFTDKAAGLGIRENDLASAAAGVPVYSGESGFKFFLTSGFHSHAEDVARFSARNEELFGIDSSEWALGEAGRRAAADAYSLYATGEVLLDSSKYSGIVGVGWQSFAPALRLSRENSLPVVCEFAHVTVPAAIERAERASHEDAALASAKAVVASDPNHLADIVSEKAGRVVGLDANPAMLDSLMHASRQVHLVRQRRGLEHVVRHPGASGEERRLAAGHVKSIDAELEDSSEFVVESRSCMGLGHGLDAPAVAVERKAAVAKAAGLRSASGRPLGKHAALVYASCSGSGARAISNLVSSLSYLPTSTVLVLNAGDKRELASRQASTSNVSNRLALVPSDDAELMAASQAVLFDSLGRALSDYGTAVGACSSAQWERSPVLLCGTGGPLALHGHEMDLSQAPVTVARQLERAVNDSTLRNQLASSAKRLASAGWGWDSHAVAFNSFVSRQF